MVGRNRFLIASTLLHVATAIWLAAAPVRPTQKPETIEIVPVQAEPKIDLGVPKSGTHKTETGRISNNGTLPGGLSERLTAENYIERLRSQIEPPWRRDVARRLKIRRTKCTTCLSILIDARGNLLGQELTQSCPDIQLDMIAKHTLDRNFPPPPSNLLINNLLTIDWCFYVK